MCVGIVCAQPVGVDLYTQTDPTRTCCLLLLLLHCPRQTKLPAHSACRWEAKALQPARQASHSTTTQEQTVCCSALTFHVLCSQASAAPHCCRRVKRTIQDLCCPTDCAPTQENVSEAEASMDTLLFRSKCRRRQGHKLCLLRLWKLLC